MIFSVTFSALALVLLHRIEDVVRFERELLRGWGTPQSQTRGRMCSAAEIESDPDFRHALEREVLGRIEHETGGLPGDHISMKLPVHPYTRWT